MKDPIKAQRVLRPDLLWARARLEEVMFGCILNIKLYQSGICTKLIVDMNEQELTDYTKLLESIFTR